MTVSRKTHVFDLVSKRISTMDMVGGPAIELDWPPDVAWTLLPDRTEGGVNVNFASYFEPIENILIVGAKLFWVGEGAIESRGTNLLGTGFECVERGLNENGEYINLAHVHTYCNEIIQAISNYANATPFAPFFINTVSYYGYNPTFKFWDYSVMSNGTLTYDLVNGDLDFSSNPTPVGQRDMVTDWQTFVNDVKLYADPTLPPPFGDITIRHIETGLTRKYEFAGSFVRQEDGARANSFRWIPKGTLPAVVPATFELDVNANNNIRAIGIAPSSAVGSSAGTAVTSIVGAELAADPAVAASVGAATLTGIPPQFVALGAVDSYIRRVANDQGISWQSVAGVAQVVGNDVGWTSVARGAGVFVMSYRNVAGTNQSLWSSSNGINWTRRTGNFVGTYDVAYGNGLFVSLSDTSIYTSTDGITWTVATKTSVGLSSNNYAIFFKDGYFYTGNTTTIRRSTDAVTWSSITPSGAGSSSGVGAFVANGDVILALPISTTPAGYLRSSDNGVSWQRYDLPATGTYYRGNCTVAAGGGWFVITSPTFTGINGYRSEDGITWSSWSVTNLAPAKSIVWAGDRFIVVGGPDSASSVEIATSTDGGATWTNRTTATRVLPQIVYRIAP